MIEKENIIYNLATKRSQHSRNPSIEVNQQQSNVLGVSDTVSSYKCESKDGSINIFEQEKCEKQELAKQTQPYEILCKKQVEAYKARAKKVKNIKFSSLLRSKVSESFSTTSRQTLNDSLQLNNCLTKNQLSQYYKTLKQKDQSFVQKTLPSSKNKFTSRNNSFDIAQVKLKHKKYTEGWELMNDRTSKINLGTLSQMSSYNTTRMVSRHVPTIVNFQSERKKIEELQNRTLKLLKQNIKPFYWPGNLREPISLKHTFDKKYVQKVERQGFGIKGCNKLEKEYDWLKQRKNNLFETVEGRDKFSKQKLSENEQNMIQYFEGGNKTCSRIVPLSIVR